jgi:hypothetical protein
VTLNTSWLADLMPGNRRVEVGRDDLLQGNDALAVGHDHETGQHGRHLHPGDAALPVTGSPTSTTRLSDRFEM